LDSPTGTRILFRVIGVAGDVKNDGLNNPTVPEVYMPAFHTRVETMRFVLRSASPVASLLPNIRRAVQRIDPEQPIHDVVTMRQIIQQTITLERAASFLTGFFAAAALLMATLGVYGVLSYSVRQRTVEIGVRMALGATWREVLSLIVGRGLRMAAYGVLTGALLAFGGSSYLVRIFQIREIGPAPFLYSIVIVAGVVFSASLMPARRAALKSPVLVIRNQA
jgi:ABC-type antimicrobial peptide transport system permease subunit